MDGVNREFFDPNWPRSQDLDPSLRVSHDKTAPSHTLMANETAPASMPEGITLNRCAARQVEHVLFAANAVLLHKGPELRREHHGRNYRMSVGVQNYQHGTQVSLRPRNLKEKPSAATEEVHADSERYQWHDPCCEEPCLSTPPAISIEVGDQIVPFFFDKIQHADDRGVLLEQALEFATENGLLEGMGCDDVACVAEHLANEAEKYLATARAHEGVHPRPHYFNFDFDF